MPITGSTYQNQNIRAKFTLQSLKRFPLTLKSGSKLKWSRFANFVRKSCSSSKRLENFSFVSEPPNFVFFLDSFFPVKIWSSSLSSLCCSYSLELRVPLPDKEDKNVALLFYMPISICLSNESFQSQSSSFWLMVSLS